MSKALWRNFHANVLETKRTLHGFLHLNTSLKEALHDCCVIRLEPQPETKRFSRGEVVLKKMKERRWSKIIEVTWSNSILLKPGVSDIVTCSAFNNITTMLQRDIRAATCKGVQPATSARSRGGRCLKNEVSKKSKQTAKDGKRLWVRLSQRSTYSIAQWFWRSSKFAFSKGDKTLVSRMGSQNTIYREMGNKVKSEDFAHAAVPFTIKSSWNVQHMSGYAR